MTSNAWQALEEQVTLLGRWVAHPEVAAELADSGVGAGRLSGQDIFDGLGIALTKGESVYVAPNICQLIEVAASSAPEETSLAIRDVPWRDAFVLFGKPIASPASAFLSVAGVAWCIVATFKDPAAAPGAHLLRGVSDEEWNAANKRLMVVFIARIDGHLFPITWAFLTDGLTLKELIEELPSEVGTTNKEAFEQKVRAILTLLHFLNEPLAARSVARDMPRAMRRRMPSLEGVEPVVRIIELRRPKGVPSGEPGQVDWACQWFVTGHWRRQYYPRLHEYRSKWINAYLKGPPDKPLKAPAPRIFAVVR